MGDEEGYDWNRSFNPPTVITVYDTSNTIKITPNEGDFIFTPNMVGGSITIEEFFNVGSIEVQQRTEQNFLPNPNLEEIVMDDIAGTPAIIDAAWDSSLHNTAVQVVGWTSGFDGGTQVIGMVVWSWIPCSVC